MNYILFFCNISELYSRRSHYFSVPPRSASLALRSRALSKHGDGLFSGPVLTRFCP